MTRNQSPIIKLRAAHEIVFSPTEDRAAFFGGQDVNVLNLLTRSTLFSAHPIAHPSHIDFSPDGQRLLLKSTSGRTVILDACTGKIVKDFHNQNEGEGSKALFTKCSRYVVTVSWNGLLSVRDSVTAEQTFMVSHLGCMLNNLSAPADRSFFIYSVGRLPPSNSEPPPPQIVILHSWPIVGKNYRELPQQWSFINALQVSPSGRFLGVIHGAPPETLEIYDIGRSQVIARQKLSIGGCGCSIGWSHDEQLLAVNGKDKFLVLERENLAVRYEFSIQYPCFAAFSPFSRFLAIGSWRKSFIVPIDCLDSFEV